MQVHEGKVSALSKLSSVGANIVAAATVGFTKVVVAVGAAALALPGPLQEHMGAGIGAIIVGGAIATVIATFSSSIRGALVETPSAPAVLLGLFGASIARDYPAVSDPGVLAAMIFVLYAFAAVVTGLFFVSLGTLRLGNFIRFIPYPVVAGVLAGVGILMVKGSFGIATGIRLEAHSLSQFMSPDMAAHWLPAVLFGLSLLAVSRRYSGTLVMPAMLVAALLLFYAIATGLGASHAALASGNWMLGPFPAGSLYKIPDYGQILHIPFDLWFRFSFTLVAVVLISTVCLLLNASALELELRKEADLNRELRWVGVGNIGGGIFGGLPCYHSILSTLLLRNMRGSRFAPLLVVAFWVATVFFGAAALAYFPRPVLAGVIFYLGFGLLWDWLVKTWSTLPRADWYVVLLIVMTTALIGYLEGLGLGTLAGIILFQIGYSKVPIVKHAFSAAALSSCVERTTDCCEKLKQHGERCLVLQLQGYLFFGNAHRIVQRARSRLAEKGLPPLDVLILDFRRVEGLDYATVTSFRRLKQMIEEAGAQLALAGLGPSEVSFLTKGGVIDPGSDPGSATVKVFDDWDEALEWHENRLLDSRQLPAAPGPCDPQGWPGWLLEALPTAEAQGRLQGYLTTFRLAAGETLVRQNEPSDCLYILYSGRASIYLQEAGVRVRVKTYLAGTVIGEIGLYLSEPRTATVVVDNEISGARLDQEAFQRMWDNDPDIARAFDRAILILLGRRLAETNRLLTSVMR